MLAQYTSFSCVWYKLGVVVVVGFLSINFIDIKGMMAKRPLVNIPQAQVVCPKGLVYLVPQKISPHLFIKQFLSLG